MLSLLIILALADGVLAHSVAFVVNLTQVIKAPSRVGVCASSLTSFALEVWGGGDCRWCLEGISVAPGGSGIGLDAGCEVEGFEEGAVVGGLVIFQSRAGAWLLGWYIRGLWRL